MYSVKELYMMVGSEQEKNSSCRSRNSDTKKMYGSVCQGSQLCSCSIVLSRMTTPNHNRNKQAQAKQWFQYLQD